MFELKLKCKRVPIEAELPAMDRFRQQMILYLFHKNDPRPLFLTFAVIDFPNKQIIYLSSYNKQNLDTADKEQHSEIYKMDRGPHVTISIHPGEDFLTFMDEEEFFLYINYKKGFMRVMTGNDLIGRRDIQFKRFSCTFYEDPDDANYIFISLIDAKEHLHIYRMSRTMADVEEIDSFPSNLPHVLRKYGRHLLISHEFRQCTYELRKTGKIIDTSGLARIILTVAMRIKQSRGQALETGIHYEELSSEEKRELLVAINEKYDVKCLPGNIKLMNLDTKEKTVYATTGGNPAHFEIDNKTGYIYTSSHHIIAVQGKQVFYEPAVIDQYRLENNELRLTGSFSHPKGYRYTSHRVFYMDNKPYICTFGQPNRLFVIDAEKMELLYYDDIGEDVLSNEQDLFLFLNTRDDPYEIVALEVSEDGKMLLCVCPQFIYLYNLEERKLECKINYLFPGITDGLVLKTLHTNYFDF